MKFYKVLLRETHAEVYRDDKLVSRIYTYNSAIERGLLNEDYECELYEIVVPDLSEICIRTGLGALAAGELYPQVGQDIEYDDDFEFGFTFDGESEFGLS